MSGIEANITMEDRLEYLDKNIDDMFLVFNAIIVSLMQAGFACLEAGCVNSKNVTSIIMKNVLDLFICGICYWLVGYSLAYSPGNSLLGYSWWAGVGVSETSMAHWFFQFIFAATAATIISGAVAERCNFAAYIVYSSVISGFVYPVVSHWAWGEGGFLATLGYRDFAGSGVVHAVAGVCSFIAAAFVGPRIGRFENGLVVEKPGHSVPLVGIGGLLLVSGFLAFNGGSLGHISQPGDSEIVARSITSTIMGGSGAAVVVLVLSKVGLLGPPTWAFSTTLNAVLAGMVSICAAADIYSTLGAIITGAIACPVYLVLRSFVIYLRVDDPLDAVAVHFGAGVWGVIAMPIFSKGGLAYGVDNESVAQLWHNTVGVLVMIIWSTVCSVLLFGLLRLLNLLRVSESEELEGLDISKHNEPAYPEKGWHVSHPPSVHNHNTLKKHGSYSPALRAFSKQPTLAFDNMAMEMENHQRLR
ncbi:putative ammonium transporter 1 [Macrosteles quadrilineatus]|uniref:putative ammonium transporter 1 n=1 Tax=Macrosteles quadrilineatus TaxID=74068 RepID=UPI0023E332FF|nr:putative ammonium transporter 1 [Macrosteles quadrilineatus]